MFEKLKKYKCEDLYFVKLAQVVDIKPDDHDFGSEHIIFEEKKKIWFATKVEFYDEFKIISLNKTFKNDLIGVNSVGDYFVCYSDSLIVNLPKLRGKKLSLNEIIKLENDANKTTEQQTERHV